MSDSETVKKSDFLCLLRAAEYAKILLDREGIASDNAPFDPTENRRIYLRKIADELKAVRSSGRGSAWSSSSVKLENIDDNGTFDEVKQNMGATVSALERFFNSARDAQYAYLEMKEISGFSFAEGSHKC